MMPEVSRWGLWLGFAAAGLLPAEEYAGRAECKGCHAAEWAGHTRSAHAGALARAERHPMAESFAEARTLVRKPEYVFAVRRAESGLRVKINDRAEVMDLPLEWAFGAGRQAVTFVSRVNREYYVEHYASYYPALRGFGATPGQAALTPKTLAQAAGVVYPVADPKSGIAGCFECHSTGPVKFAPDGEAGLTEEGVQCESCHGAAGEHARDPRRRRPENPGKMGASELNRFCGRCHRPPAEKGSAIDWNYAWNVRHQPVYLSESQCFKASVSKGRGALSCLTCHGAHEGTGEGIAARANGRCAQCHPGAGRRPAAACTSAATPANCVDCHMPMVSPQSPLRFTNHWIGIYRTGSKLKPSR